MIFINSIRKKLGFSLLNYNLLYSVAFIIILTGCKPTEQGYKAAYDAALNKREAASSDLDVTLPPGAIQSVDGPQQKEIDGITVYLDNKRITPIESDSKLKYHYNVAIGVYKMPTNCKAQSETLKLDGYDAFAAKDSEGNYYTIAASFPTLSEAVKFYNEFKKDKNRIYVGLPDAPVIIYSPI